MDLILLLREEPGVARVNQTRPYGWEGSIVERVRSGTLG
jgi:hypothetical protein